MHFACDKWRDKLEMLWFIKSRKKKNYKIFSQRFAKNLRKLMESILGERKSHKKERKEKSSLLRPFGSMHHDMAVGEGQGCSSCFSRLPWPLSGSVAFLSIFTQTPPPPSQTWRAFPIGCGAWLRAGREREENRGENSMADLKFKVSKKLVNNYWLFFPSQTL